MPFICSHNASHLEGPQCLNVLVFISALEENHEEFENVDFWYVPCNYSIVNVPVVMAKFVENQKCQLDVSVQVQGEMTGNFFWFCSDFFPFSFVSDFLSPLLLSTGAILYISFVNATTSYGCAFFEDLLPAIKIMNPLASLFAAVESIEDFGLYSEPYGNFSSYQHSGLSLTMINVPAWRRVEEILSSEVNVTASMTPCKCKKPSFRVFDMTLL